jgi:thiol-disulfide isomerase/thioredoxin
MNNIIFVQQFWTYIIIAILLVIIVYMYCNKEVCPVQQLIKSEEGYARVSSNNKTNKPQITQPVPVQLVDDSIGEIVLYYATWCGYSKMFLPIWDKFEKYAKENLPKLVVKSIRCEGGEERACFEKGIEGYPTVILYPKNKTELVFESDRSLEQLIEFINTNL